jgi:hypothetical protein
MQNEKDQTDGTTQALLCPLCKYDQTGVQSHICPECGIEIDLEIMGNDLYHSSIHATKILCVLGICSWLFCGFGLWLLGMASIALAETYGGLIPSYRDYAGVWLRSMIVIAPIALLFGWYRSSADQIYSCTLRGVWKMPRVLYRVQAISIPGILGAGGFLFLLMLALSS